MKFVVLATSFILMACDPDSHARGQFQYCLGAAHPASAEAIKACHEAAWPKERLQEAKQMAELAAQTKVSK